MNFAKKAATSKKQNRVSKGQEGSTGPNHQTGNKPFPHLSRNQNTEENSKTRVVRPPVLRPPTLKQNLNIFSYVQPNSFVKKQETSEEKKNRLKRQLDKFESPFKWKPRQVKPFNEPDSIIIRMQKKDKEVKDERKFKWRNFIFHLVITYELWRAKKLSQALEEVCGLESILRNKLNICDYMFTCIEDALWHVVTACRAFLYLEQDMVTQAEEIMGSIRAVATMSQRNQAGIHGIRAGMFMEYGHEGNKNALKEALEAVRLDRTGAEWHFFISKCMGRIRRVALCHELVYPQEVKAINEAVKLDKHNATYVVFLAQVLCEQSFREYKKYYPENKSEQFIKIEKRNKAAMHYFMESVEMSPNSPHILIRCAKGMMKLPTIMKNLKFTKECIDKALELAPNNLMVHHVKGMYHERYDCDSELPLQAYEKAASEGNFGAAMDLVKLHHKLRTGDVVEELERLATIYEQTEKLQVIYTQAGSYLLFIKKDIIGALKYYLKVVDMDTKSYAMMSHKPIFFRLKDPVNMFDVLLEELEAKTDWKSFSPEDVKVLRGFTIKVREHKSLPNERRNRLTVEKILENSRKIVANDDLYKENKRRRRLHPIFKRKKNEKRWHGTKKAACERNKEKKTCSNESKNIQVEGAVRRSVRQCINTNVHRGRRDSSSSVNTVDSDYNRDSTIFGPREFGFYPENPYNTTNEDFSSRTHEMVEDLSLNLSRQCISGRLGQSGRASRDSSITSISSAGSSVSYTNNQAIEVRCPSGNKLTVENLKKFDTENAYDTGIRRLSKLTLTSASSLSQGSSTDTTSVIERVRQSYAMLNLNKEQVTKGNKKYIKKCGSTQNLCAQKDAKWKKENKSISKSGSSQSLNIQEENLDSKFSKSFKSRFASRDSSLEGSRSLSFMPAFALKNSQSDLEKS